MKSKTYNKFFMSFANKTKMDIIMSLRNGPLSVTEIVKKVGKEQSTVSHDLRRLSRCHILHVKQKGKQRIYSLNKQTVLPILETVEKHVRKNCPRGCNL